ncbi:MAG: ArsA-related P-loop ATPase [Acidobacteriota bacterium]|nr:ArsA-related P-loop ATPase [Acidobacteriota bacterium]
MNVLDQLARRSFVVVTGKGGVGKSVLATALGMALAARGGRVLVLEVDPRESVHQLLDLPPSGGEVMAVEGDFSGSLSVQNLKPRQALDELVREQIGTGMIARRVLSSETYEQLAAGAPGLKELAILDYAERRSREAVEDGAGSAATGPFDTVVLDAPATGHGVSLLAAPSLVSEVVQQGPVGRKATELADFVGDPERLALVILTLAEEMPVQEALELRREFRDRLDREPELLVINGLYPPLSENAAAEATGADPEPALAAWYRRRRINDRELERLAERWQGPRVQLPLLAVDRGPELVSALRQRLEAEADAAAAEEG